ncbi:MAG: bifunctional DNA-formamidopyrimidine glycosylase/DNA-(apurinic or apyrimidinic site) lyase [Bacilli bacterium]|jgi:formamidopyrimidine-DNA glycosylase
MRNKMPELPEVETIKNILQEKVVGKTINRIVILRKQTIVGNADEFIRGLEKAVITSLSRKGKFIIFHLSNRSVIVSHLRMEGKYYYFDECIGQTPYQRVIFEFTDNSSLVYDDSRQFGIMMLKNENNYLSTAPLSELGQEPFNIVNIDALYEIIHHKNIAIKSVLLDQHIISGLGNIYVDEVLFLSKIHPLTSSNLITREEFALIVKNSCLVLTKAIKAGGSTIRSYHPADGIDGNFQNQLNAYGRENEPCPICKTPMRKIVVGGRGSSYCPHCQIKKTERFVLGVTGPICSGKSTICDILNKNDYIVISADKIVSELYENQAIIDQLKCILKDEKIISDGKLDKTYFKKIIVENEKDKRKIEHFIHPLIFEKIKNMIQNSNKNSKIAVEIPLLFESRFDELCNAVLFVDINRDNQIRNIKKRGLDVKESFKLNASFNHDVDKLLSNYVIVNENNIQEIIEQLKLRNLI